MTVKEAAIQILTESGKPLHVDEITRLILERKLWQTDGKTPSHTVAARIYSDIKHKGNASAFIQTDTKTFALRKDYTASQKKQLNKPATKAVKKQKSAKKIKTLSFADSAEKILEEYGNKFPMHYRDITKKALELGILETHGLTPEASMYAQILTEISRKKRQGVQPRFVQHGKGMVGLSLWMGKGLAYQIEQHNKKVRESLLKQLFKMEWYEFEELIAEFLPELGFDRVELTPRQNDKGIDVRGTLVSNDVIRIRMAVQVKKWKKNIQRQTVQRVRGSLSTHEQGLIITTSDFSKGAKEEAARESATPVFLMNGEEMVNLMIDHKIGIVCNIHEIYELDNTND